MSEYREFRRWASEKARELSEHPEAERAFLRDIQRLNQELLEVVDGLRDLSRASPFTLWSRLKRWAHLFPEPLAEVRHQMRRIRLRHGEPDRIGPREP